MRAAVRDWLPVALWMGAIFWGSSRSTLPSSLGAQSASGDWLRNATHMAEYAILAALAYRALRRGAAREPSLSLGALRWKATLLALALSLGYAFLDEAHQVFVPGRQFALADMALDLAGALLSLGMIGAIQR